MISVAGRLLAGLVFVLAAAPQGAAFAEELPPSADVPSVVGHAQAFNLTCESRSAADWAAALGVPLSEDDVFSRLQRTDDPETGFVGDPNGVWGNIPPKSYGVHPPPVAAVLQSYGLPAAERRGMSWDDLRAEIAAGKPVIVWIIGSMWSGKAVTYHAADGITTTVAPFEHTMLAVGYTESQVKVIDASNGALQSYPIASFMDSWSVLGNRAIVYEGNPPEKQRPSVSTYTVQPGDWLAGVAFRYNLDWQELARLNGIAYPYVIYPGQVLNVAASNTEPAVKASAVVSSTPAPPADVCTVQPGDWLASLARRFGTSWQSLAELNGIGYPYVIYPGQILRLR